MTELGKFIKVLKSTRIFKVTRGELVKQIMNSAGIRKTIEIESYGKWLDREIPKNMNYFMSDEENFEINKEGIAKYFSLWTKNSWKKLQEKFNPDSLKLILNKSVDSDDCRWDDCIVDCNTNDFDCFCQSLLNQFLKSLELPYEDTRNTTKDEESSSLQIPTHDNINNETIPLESIGVNDSTFKLRCVFPKTPEPFFERQQISSRISEILTHRNYAVLTGNEGIGRTVMAMDYTKKYEKNSVVQYVDCDKCSYLRSAIARLDYDEKYVKTLTFDEIISKFKSCQRRTLIILGNLDIKFDECDADDFKNLINCSEYINFMIIRENINGFECNDTTFNIEVPIKPVANETLLAFYKKIRGGEVQASEDKFLIEIFEMLEHNTSKINSLAIFVNVK